MLKINRNMHLCLLSVLPVLTGAVTWTLGAAGSNCKSVCSSLGGCDQDELDNPTGGYSSAWATALSSCSPKMSPVHYRPGDLQTLTHYWLPSPLHNGFYLGCQECLLHRVMKPNLLILEPFKHTLMAQQRSPCKRSTEWKPGRHSYNGIAENEYREGYCATQHQFQDRTK